MQREPYRRENTRRAFLASAGKLSLTALTSRRLLDGAAAFWNRKAPSEWSSQEIAQLTTHSPWAREVNAEFELTSDYTTGGADGPGIGRGGALTAPGAGAPSQIELGRDRNDNPRSARHREPVTVRWESAQPVLDALGGVPLAPDLQGRYVDLHLDPPRASTVARRCPPLYFGGLSEEAREVAAQQADVYLMWPDTVAAVGDLIADMRARATRYGRTLRFGFRVHVVVRDTEAEARGAAAYLVSALDDEEGARIRARSLDSGSVGVRRQAELREGADTDGYIEQHLWTGIGRARSGCGAAIVGDPQQVLDTLQCYRQLGIDAFILSGYPHLDEARRFADLVLPHMAHAPLH